MNPFLYIFPFVFSHVEMLRAHHDAADINHDVFYSQLNRQQDHFAHTEITGHTDHEFTNFC